MLNQIAQLKPGDDATIGVVRGAQQIDLKVKIGKRPLPKPEADN
jgi:S1-C subfamily serine protease